MSTPKKSESQRLKKLNLPPEEVLRQLLLKMVEMSDCRYWESPRANARFVSINKAAKSSLLVLRSLLDTNEFPIGTLTDGDTHEA